MPFLRHLLGDGWSLLQTCGGGTITVCLSHKNGALYKAKTCGKHDKKLTWNKQGPQGIQGVQGAKGDKGGQRVQGPPGPTFGVTQMGSPFEATTTPPATTDETSSDATQHGRHFDFTLPTSGNAYIHFYTPVIGVTCSAGAAQAGLYLDGTPVAGTDHTLAPAVSAHGWDDVAVVAVGAGAHLAEVR